MNPPLNESDPQVRLVRRVCQHIESHLDEVLTLTDLGKAMHVSPAHLQRLFKRVTGISPRQYAEAHRLGRAEAPR